MLILALQISDPTGTFFDGFGLDHQTIAVVNIAVEDETGDGSISEVSVSLVDPPMCQPGPDSQ